MGATYYEIELSNILLSTGFLIFLSAYLFLDLEDSFFGRVHLLKSRLSPHPPHPLTSQYGTQFVAVCGRLFELVFVVVEPRYHVIWIKSRKSIFGAVL